MDASLDLLVGGRTRCTPDWWDSEGFEIEDYHRIYAPRRGGAWFVGERGAERVEAGRIYLIAGHRRVERRCDREMVVDWLHFRVGAADVEAAVIECGVVRACSSAVTRRWLETMGRAGAHFSAPTFEGSLRLRAMVLEVLAESAGVRMDRAGRGAGRGAGAAWRDRLAPAVSLMQSRCEENPSLEEAARAVHLSPSHFHRRFREAFGVTPHAFVQRQRMRRAVSLLRGGGHNVSEAAEAVGYPSVYYFSRAFKRHFGVPPSTVRHASGPAVP